MSGRRFLELLSCSCRLRLRKPIATPFSECDFHCRSSLTATPRYFALSPAWRIWPCNCRLTLMTLVGTYSNDLAFFRVNFHLHHFLTLGGGGDASSSCWSCYASSLLPICRYRSASSAKSLVSDCVDSECSLTNAKNKSCPRTVPWRTPEMTWASAYVTPSNNICCFL